MHKSLNFFKRNLKEMLRDPLIYLFCLGFPLIMLILFHILNKYTGDNTPMFELRSLLPSILMFSYTFVMLTLSLIVSKDRQTFFLKRLYSSPMKTYDFILGYCLVGLFIGFLQTAVCILTAFILSVISTLPFISFGGLSLLALSQLPILITNVFLGLLLGTVFNDKSAPGICSVFISLSGILGGCWMPLENMGNFEVFCRCLPFYPSVYIGRCITGAKTALGTVYTFNSVAHLGWIPITLFMLGSILFALITFRLSRKD